MKAHAENILIIEDDAVLSDQLAGLLKAQNYSVDLSHDGDAGLANATQNRYDLILLDVMLPKRDGFSVLKLLRRTSNTPVIMITAKGAEEERLKGFSSGADDYVAKPFNTTELMFRIEAILRRCQPSKLQHSLSDIDLDGLTINRVEQVIYVGLQRLDFTPTQYELLLTLALYKGEVLTKAFLYQTVLKKNYGEYDRSLDMHVSRVRRKLSAANWLGERLRSVHGKGYCLT